MVCGAAAYDISPGSSLEMQTLGSHTDLLNQQLLFTRWPRDACVLSDWESAVLGSIPCKLGNGCTERSDYPDWFTEVRLRASWLVIRRPLLATFPPPLQFPILTPGKPGRFNSVYTSELPEKFLLKYYYLDSTPDLLYKNVLGKGRGFQKPSRCLTSRCGWR